MWVWGADSLNSMNGYFIMNRVEWSAVYTVYSCVHFKYIYITVLYVLAMYPSLSLLRPRLLEVNYSFTKN